MIKKENGFTLVELIVVMTILSILGTLWFVSFQWYQLDTRNSKRNYDIKNLSEKIEITFVSGVDFSYMLADTWSTLTSTGVSIAWFSWYTLIPGKYAAGNINYSKIWVLWEDFLDPKFKVPYVMAYSSYLGAFQIAATTELEGWDYDITSAGTYSPRKSGTGWTRWTRERIIGNKFITTQMDPRELGFIEWDNVWISTWEYIIKRINRNEITLDRTITTPGENIFLKQNESRYLIKKWDSNFPIDTGLGYKYTPYYSE